MTETTGRIRAICVKDAEAFLLAALAVLPTSIDLTSSAAVNGVVFAHEFRCKERKFRVENGDNGPLLGVFVDGDWKPWEETGEWPLVAPDYIEIDGLQIDPETGEILGDAQAPRIHEGLAEEAMRILSRIQRADAKAHAELNHAEVVQARAIVANAELAAATEAKKAAWLRRQYEGFLAEAARRALAREKGKTWKTRFGSVALRIVKGGVKVENEEAAIEWAEKHCPDAVKVKKSFLISRIPSDVATELEKAVLQAREPDSAPVPGFVYTFDREAVKIETGVAPG